MSVDTPAIATDAHAEERLDEEPVGVKHGGQGYLFTLDTPNISIVAYVHEDVDAARLHQGIAGVCHTAINELHHEREVLKE